MAEIYDATLHHVGLRTKDGLGSNYGFMVQGSLSQDLQREAMGSPDFGGATDLIGQAPSLSRWTQDNFIGGQFQWNWGRDDGMFADSLGFIPDPQGRSLLSCPPLHLAHAFNVATKSGYLSREPSAMFIVGGVIFVIFGHGILRYDIATGTESWKFPLGVTTYVTGGYNPDDETIWILCNDATAGQKPSIERVNTDLTSPSFDVTFAGPSGTENLTAYGMTIRGSAVLVSIGRKVWIGDVPNNPDPTANSTITWTNVGRLPGKWQDSQAYSGMTYILCSDGTYQSSIVAYDGDGILPIATFPSSFDAKCMTEYAGRIFVGGTGTDVNGDELYAELYEVTGASVRTVRTFTPETRSPLTNSGWPTTINDLVIHEGLLWFGQIGKRLMAYDVTSDGFFSGSEILNDSTADMRLLVAGWGRVWAFGQSNDANRHGVYRIAQPGDTLAGTWNPTFVTSDFGYEPGMKKRWSDLKIMHRYGVMSSVEYSLDSGATWTALTFTTATSGQVYYTTAALSAVPVSEHIRFRFKFGTTDALTYHRELVSFTLSFAFLDTGKYAWSFTINGSASVETKDSGLPDGRAGQTQDVSSLTVRLGGWARDKVPLIFTDADGQTWDVHIVGYRRTMPTIGPAVDGTYVESHHAVTLIEV